MCIGTLFAKLNPFNRHKKRGVKNDMFLTPYEKEMVPILLHEMHSTNSRFYEVVCYRWHKELIAYDLVDEKKGTPRFNKDGLCLRLVVNKLARTLLEKGVIDEECEQRITSFRQRRLSQCTPKKSAKMTRSHSQTIKFFSRDASSLRVPDIGSPRRRFSSRASSSSTATMIDTVFLILGEILVSQFKCTVNNEEGNVHERELKLIVWKHFIQTLIACLIDKV